MGITSRASDWEGVHSNSRSHTSPFNIRMVTGFVRTRRMTCNDALIKLVGRSMGHQRAANQQVHADNTWLPLERRGRSCQFSRFDATQLQFGDISPNQTLEHFCYKNFVSFLLNLSHSFFAENYSLTAKSFKRQSPPFHYATAVSLATEFVERNSNNAPNEQITFRECWKVLNNWQKRA